MTNHHCTLDVQITSVIVMISLIMIIIILLHHDCYCFISCYHDYSDYCINIWLVVWNMYYFSIFWEESSQLTNIFQRGSNHQPVIVGGVHEFHIHFRHQDFCGNTIMGTGLIEHPTNWLGYNTVFWFSKT